MKLQQRLPNLREIFLEHQLGEHSCRPKPTRMLRHVRFPTEKMRNIGSHVQNLVPLLSMFPLTSRTQLIFPWPVLCFSNLKTRQDTSKVLFQSLITIEGLHKSLWLLSLAPLKSNTQTAFFKLVSNRSHNCAIFFDFLSCY